MKTSSFETNKKKTTTKNKATRMHKKNGKAHKNLQDFQCKYENGNNFSK